MAEFNLDSDGCGLADGEVNVSYQVYPDYRGRGFAVRAVTLLVEYLRSVPGVTAAVLRVAPENTASVRVAAKAGFTDCGRTSTPGSADLRVFRRSVPLAGSKPGQPERARMSPVIRCRPPRSAA